MTKRICMWSGPRNISTAMMRSWENRTDTQVVDEPFYAFYLAQTQAPHPCFEQVLASQSNAFDDVVKELTASNTDCEIFYQKHMTHHMLEGVDMSWSKDLLHCFLIRDPRQVVQSYSKKRDDCSVDDIGIIRQWQLYQQITDISGQDIPVVDSNDVQTYPKDILSSLCKRLSIAFSDKMLHWPKGRRNSDGVWAEHWYHVVEESTGFTPYQPRDITLTDEQQSVVETVMPYYEKMFERRIKPGSTD